MRNKILCMVLSASIITSFSTSFNLAYAKDISDAARIMEKLDRGLVAVKLSGGVYLSWRLLGTESLSDQAFDVYRNGTKIYTTGAHDATCYTDASGKATDKYKVVRAGTSATEETEVAPWTTNTTSAGSVSQQSESNSFAYTDIPIIKPDGGIAKQDPTSRNGLSSTITREYDYSANDASAGDLDGDGDYEIVLKWNPSNAEDSGTQNGNYTGNVYIDGYQTDNDGEYMWRIDLGCNIRAGAHYTQFIVYDFNCDGKAEIAMKTAPGSKDGQNKYVTEAGDTEAIRNADNSIDYREASNGGSAGRILSGPEYLTIFDGETGAAIYTTDYIPRGNVADWGDNYGNRSERYLAGVAYLDGVHPSLIMTRGYYMKAVAYAYNFDGQKLDKVWECNGNSKDVNSLYGQGAHSLSVADIDNDGKDEIVYCSAAIDDDGKVIGNTLLGHGDALHVSDFNNDGVQEAFSVKEDSEGFENNAADFRIPKQAPSVWGQGAGGDTGRGVMGNIDDNYAKTNSNALSLGWSSSHPNVFDLSGNEVNPANKTVDNNGYGSKPAKAASGTFDNSLIYWDGDLGRELLDDYVIQKYYADTGTSRRFYTGTSGYTFQNIHINNDTKRNMSLVADILGDWREEVIAPLSDDSALRIFMSTIPTTYRLTTLMHDSQYRVAVAWQNVGYNQPAHQSYYIGSAALAKDANGQSLNYLAPNAPFTEMTYPGDDEAPAPVPPSKTVNNVVYEKGTSTETAWTSADISGWTQTGTASLTYDAAKAAYGGIYHTHAGNAAAYAVSKSFSFTPNSIVTYEVDWYLNNTIKKNNTVYLQFGSALRIGSCKDSGSNYFTWIKTGDTWDDLDNDGNLDNVYSTKVDNKPIRVKLIVDTSTNKIVSFEYAGKTLAGYENKELSGTVDSITFGADKNSVSWALTAGINSIKVTEAKEGAEITSITASTTKTDYKEGEDFDKSTVSVIAHYSDGSDEELTPYYFSVTGYNKDVPGEYTLTVHVGDITDTFTVNVNAKQMTELVLGGNYRTTFNYNEDLSISGLTVTAKYDNGTEENIADYTVSGYDKTKIGAQTITVSYGGKKQTYTVTVNRTDTYISATKNGTAINAALMNYSGSAQLILAVYDGDRLADVFVRKATGMVSFTDVTIPQNGRYKIYAWEGTEKMKPLCEPYVE